MLAQLTAVERLARTSRSGRLLHNPLRYLKAVLFKDFIYPRSQKEKERTAYLFSGRTMQVLLPAATDIYLTGGKSHDSEIRLARFLIRNLNPGDHFLDIGAHYGYFSLIASDLVGPEGRVLALEPAAKSGRILQKNCAGLDNVEVLFKAISDQPGEISFYEFPNLFSEYNAMDVEQFRQEEWFADFTPVKTIVPATTVNEITSGDFRPSVIKIDVEGAELKVITGGMPYFRNNDPVIAMEYLAPGRGNEAHREALALLRQNSYQTYVPDADGLLQEVANPEQHLEQHKLESDNIILKK